MKKKLIALTLLVPLFAAGSVLRAEEPAHEGHHHGMEMTGDKKMDAAEKKADGMEMRKVQKKEIGRRAVCPVSGEKFKITAKTVSASYKGRVYYFCCPGCDKKFAKDPEKYIDGKAAQETVYVCPMGDYEGSKPGKCPKCGMKLVEKKAEVKQEQAHKRYVCPMGDYEGDKPGKCPKCGMNLVEKK